VKQFYAVSALVDKNVYVAKGWMAAKFIRDNTTKSVEALAHIGWRTVKVIALTTVERKHIPNVPMNGLAPRLLDKILLWLRWGKLAQPYLSLQWRAHELE
jgi:hypothetical protein